jgi:hypothetical protein
MSVFILFLCCPVYVAALRRVHAPSKDSYQLPIRFIQTKLRGFSLQSELYRPTERPPLVGEVSANFSGYRMSRGQRNESSRPLISVF